MSLFYTHISFSSNGAWYRVVGERGRGGESQCLLCLCESQMAWVLLWLQIRFSGAMGVRCNQTSPPKFSGPRNNPWQLSPGVQLEELVAEFRTSLAGILCLTLANTQLCPHSVPASVSSDRRELRWRLGIILKMIPWVSRKISKSISQKKKEMNRFKI